MQTWWSQPGELYEEKGIGLQSSAADWTKSFINTESKEKILKAERCVGALLPKSLHLGGWGHEEGFRSGHMTVCFSGCEVRKSEPAG